MRNLTHFIGGQHIEGASGRFLDVFNPMTGEVQARSPLASSDEVRKAIASAGHARTLASGYSCTEQFGRITRWLHDRRAGITNQSNPPS